VAQKKRCLKIGIILVETKNAPVAQVKNSNIATVA
jgi:hypothetical protein